MIDVSIVIVCMNNLTNLYPCLESIRKFTNKITYETFVVAYLFSKENLEKAKKDYPWVTFIESNVIRGFSENNNLALRLAKGRLCFILNDDTEMRMPVLDKLVETMDGLPEKVAVVSPDIRFPDGSYQCCGRPPQTWLTYIAKQFRFWDENNQIEYINKPGKFKTYNILGAAFLIRTKIFKQVGWFDEKYFFCPEDIALSTKLNKTGYSCFVDSDVSIIHIAGGSKWSPINEATKPAGVKGSIIFFSDNSKVKFVILGLTVIFIRVLEAIYWQIKAFLGEEKAVIQVRSNINVCKEIFNNKTPKEIFKKYYNR